MANPFTSEYLSKETIEQLSKAKISDPEVAAKLSKEQLTSLGLSDAAISEIEQALKCAGKRLSNTDDTSGVFDKLLKDYKFKQAMLGNFDDEDTDAPVTKADKPEGKTKLSKLFSAENQDDDKQSEDDDDEPELAIAGFPGGVAVRVIIPNGANMGLEELEKLGLPQAMTQFLLDVMDEELQTEEGVMCAFDSKTGEPAKCPTCGTFLKYSLKYGAEFCPKCDKWITPKCSNPNCESCNERPDKPSDVEDWGEDPI